MINPEYKDISLGIVSSAIEILRTDGWCQRNYHNEHGNYCVYGALECASRKLRKNPPHQSYNHHDVLEQIELFLGDLVGHSMLAFNDARGRTMEEVIDVLHRARLQLKVMS